MNTEEQYSYSSLVNMEYRQVGGLMLWLCFFMVIINPLQGAFEIWRDLVRTNGFSTQPVALLGQLLDYTAQAVLVIGGIVAGILLWQLHRKGVLLMKLWFVVYFAFVLMMTLLVVGLGALNGVAANAWGFMWPSLLIALVKSGLWWLYLDRSYRVKRTYDLKYGAASASCAHTRHMQADPK